MTDFPSSTEQAGLRQQLADQVGYYFASLISGNNQPHMSGDPRARLHGERRRRFDETCLEVVDTISAALRSGGAAQPPVDSGALLHLAERLRDTTDGYPAEDMAIVMNRVAYSLQEIAKGITDPAYGAGNCGDSAGLQKAMEIIGNLRQSGAAQFSDPKYCGQRGCDRADALYDAYVAIRSAMPSTEGKSHD